MSSMRHQRVNEDWIRFTPTNAVNRYHQGLIHFHSANDARMNAPAISRIFRSMLMGLEPLFRVAAPGHDDPGAVLSSRAPRLPHRFLRVHLESTHGVIRVLARRPRFDGLQ